MTAVKDLIQEQVREALRGPKVDVAEISEVLMAARELGYGPVDLYVDAVWERPKGSTKVPTLREVLPEWVIAEEAALLDLQGTDAESVRDHEAWPEIEASQKRAAQSSTPYVQTAPDFVCLDGLDVTAQDLTELSTLSGSAASIRRDPRHEKRRRVYFGEGAAASFSLEGAQKLLELLRTRELCRRATWPEDKS